MIKNFTFQAPVRIFFGNGSLNNLEHECSVLGTDKIMVVTDKDIASTPMFSMVIDHLRKANINPAIFYDVVSDPDEECLDKGLTTLHQNKSHALVALGGGSSIDTAKGIALLATNPPPISQYEGVERFGKQALPFIAIPTTAGTGSEMTPVVIVTSQEEKRKYVVKGSSIYARLAILDPTLLTTIPKTLAASTGMDAVVHAIESYLARLSSPMTEIYSQASLRLSAKSIRNFISDRQNLEAASDMLLASMLSGVAMSNARLGVIHSIAHSLGGRFHIAHGLSCSLVLPACLESMVNNVTEKFAVIARIMEPELEVAADPKCAKALPNIINKLLSDLGIEKGLAKFGIKESDLMLIAEDAIKSGTASNSPADFSVEDVLRILRAAYQ